MLHPTSFALRRAFTLAEMLVVIAILALLSAILLSVFSRSRALGRRATCVSNLKQIGMAMEQYAQDYRTYPNMSDYAPVAQDQTYCSIWANKLFPYLKSVSVFQCPSFAAGAYRPDCPGTSDTDGKPVSFRGSYDLNLPNASFLLTGQENNPVLMITPSNARSRFNPLRFTRPSTTILVLDGDGYFVSPGYQEPPATDTATLQQYGLNPHHEGGLNVGFADGHVKYLSLDALVKRSLWRLNGPE